MTAPATLRAKEAVGRVLDRDPATLLATDLAAAFPWLARTRLHVVRPGPAPARWLVVDVPGAAPHVVDPAALPALDALDAVVAAERLSLPHGLLPRALADVVRLFVVGARSKLVADDVLRDLATYAPTTDALAAALRASATMGPSVTGTELDWGLVFEVVLPSGAIDRWTVRGTERAVVAARPSSVAPPGAYRYPWIG